MRMSVLTATLALTFTVAGCSALTRSPGPASPFGSDDPRDTEVRIHVLNFNFSDATVWTVVNGGRRQRLGTVTGKSDATFTVPWSFSEPMRLEFHLLAGPRCFTEELSVHPGDVLELQISGDTGHDPMCR